MNRCNNCLKDYDKKEVARVNGKESMGHCSSQCYTEMITKLENQKNQSVTG
jgi:hypothetical protein